MKTRTTRDGRDVRSEGREMTHAESMEGQAGMIGREHGRNAASWYFDGNTKGETYEAILAGIVDGDPQILDSLPSSPLSGEWADAYSLSDLADELGVSQEDDSFPDVCDAYEDAFHMAVSATIESACLEYLRGAEVL